MKLSFYNFFFYILAVIHMIEGTPISSENNSSLSLIVENLHSSLPCLSCKGRCGDTTYLPPEQFLSEGACACDISCVKFGNCCPDIIHVCPELDIKLAEFELFTRSPETECYIGGICHHEARYSLINTCPFNDKICERNSKNIKTAVPVVDIETNISYSNALCALCNGVNSLIPWTIKYFTPSYCIENDGCDERNMSFVLADDFLDSLVRFHPPAGYTPRQRCNGKVKVKTTCAPDWPDDKIKKACELGGKSYIHHRVIEGSMSLTNFKNLFCAVCNHKYIPDLRCSYTVLELFCSDPEVYSFEKLFSIKSSTGIASKNFCAENETYIEKEKRCRRLYDSSLLNNKSHIEIDMELVNGDNMDLPFERAGDIITHIENSNLSYNISFYIGQCFRNWMKNTDYITIGGTVASYDVGNILDISRNISNLIAVYEDMMNFTIKISFLNNTCDYLLYNISNVNFDRNGSLVLQDGATRKPGEYLIVNNTLFICKVVHYKRNWLYSSIIGWVTIICMSISVCCLCVYLGLHCFYIPSNNLAVLSLVVCLLLSHTTFLVGPQLTSVYPACYTFGIILLWSFLLCFAWMSAIAWEILMLIYKAERLQKYIDTSYFRKFYPTVLVPTVISLLAIIIDQISIPVEWRPMFGADLCWFNNNLPLLLFFVAPIAVSTLMTATVTIIIVYKLTSMTNDPPGFERNVYSMFLKLSSITGLCWIFGFVAVPTGNMILYILFVILNASQGVFLLLTTYIPLIRKRIQSEQVSDFSYNSTELTESRRRARLTDVES